MYSDIVFPNGNENEFVRMAETLGYDRMVFAYKSEKDAKSAKIDIKTDIEIKRAVVVTNPNSKIAKGFVAFAQSGEKDREFLERANIDFICDLEGSKRKDFIHHRNSGLNHVMAKIAAEKNVAVGFSFLSILSADSNKRPVLLGRIKQNIKLCQKYGVRMLFGSFAEDIYGMRSPKDLKEFFMILNLKNCNALFY